jgi:hypothetical protein
MNHDPSGFEINTQTLERIMTLGGDLPTLTEMYDRLSTTPDIRVVKGSAPHRLRGERLDVSEKELIDDLMAFCDEVSQLPTERMSAQEMDLMVSIPGFLDSMRFLSHEAYAEAVDGLARHHVEWLRADEDRRVRFAVQRNRTQSSQGIVGRDIAAAIARTNPPLEGRVDVRLIEDLSGSLDDNTKIVIADDWSVSGNLMAQDLSHVYQVFERDGTSAQVEVNLLLAREDQVPDGIRALDRVGEDRPEYGEPAVVAYHRTPAVKGIYGQEAVPTGSHSAVDYGFSETLGSMYRLLERYGGRDTRGLPYAAAIVPTYAYDYEKA